MFGHRSFLVIGGGGPADIEMIVILEPWELIMCSVMAQGD